MTLPYPIASTQTDAKSPIDQQLMDAFRLNQEYLDAQVGAASGGGIINFRVNGYLNRIKALLDIGAGKKLDGGIITNAVTFTNAFMYLEKGGTSGALEVDVLRHKEIQRAIESITAQYTGSTQSIGRLGSSLNTQAVSLATPVISTQLIDKPKGSINIETIAILEDGRVLYTFSGTTQLDSDYQVGDSIVINGCTNGANDGTFVIDQVNYDGLPSVVITNGSAVAQNAAAGTGELQLYRYTFLASVDDDFVVGEEVIFSGHSSGNNNGTYTIYGVNQGGNNILVKNANGVDQGAPAGSAQCTRWIYAFSSAVDDTQYIVGESAEMASHTSGNNNGKFVIRRVNEAGNNLYVTNNSGVAQGGAAGNTNTLRWLYSLPSDPSADVSVGDRLVFSGHSSANNDGTFEVKTVNRFALNNVEVFNVDGLVQGGVAGTSESTLKLINFLEDFASDFVVDTSKVALENLVVGDILEELDVKEINRGGFSNYNIVVDSETLATQDVAAGRVAREIRTIFETRPRIEVAQANQVRNLQTDVDATFVVGGVDANTILTMDIIEVPEGLPSTMVLSLS